LAHLFQNGFKNSYPPEVLFPKIDPKKLKLFLGEE